MDPAASSKHKIRHTVKAHLDLCRVSNLPTVWTNVLAAVVLAGSGWTPGMYLILAVSMSAFYAGGMCLNDIFDAGYDAIHNPTRPIPSGRLPIKGAWKIAVLLLGGGLLLLFISPHRQALFAGILLLASIVVYDRYHKNHGWCVFVMGACRFLVFAVSALAVSGSLGPRVWLAGILQFVYVLLLSATSRWEQQGGTKVSFPLIPLMIAGISLLDGVVLAVFISPLWLLAGVGGALLTLIGQRYVRGD